MIEQLILNSWEIKWTKVDYLSNLKKFICKLFAIEPQTKYSGKVRLQSDYYRVGDVFSDKFGVKWIITETVDVLGNKNYFDAKTIDLVTDKLKMGSNNFESTFLHYSTQKEG